MSNGHVVIHDPLSNHNSLSDHRSTSDTDGMEDTPEFRLIMAYAKRRRPTTESPAQDSQTLLNGGTNANGSASPQMLAKTEKEEENNKKKKKKRKKGLKQRIFSCIKPQTRDEEPSENNFRKTSDAFRAGDLKDTGVKEDELNKVASKLTKIADDIPFIPPEIESDAPEDENVERVIGLLLREVGDRADEQVLKDANIAAELFFHYSFFEKLIKALLRRMGLGTPDPDRAKDQIAVTCEVTSRLSAVNTLPRNRLLGHGARYLQHYYSSWAQQQGGYGEAFYSDDEDDAS